MKLHPGILFLLTACLIALSMNAARACGSGDAGHAAKFHHEAASDSDPYDASPTHCNDDSDACEETHSGQDCPPDTDGCGHCHCPGCGMISGGPSSGLQGEYCCLSRFKPSDDAATRQAFYFAEHIPEEVYRAIWQPPKSGA